MKTMTTMKATTANHQEQGTKNQERLRHSQLQAQVGTWAGLILALVLYQGLRAEVLAGRAMPVLEPLLLVAAVAWTLVAAVTAIRYGAEIRAVEQA
jgi:hypothetical protein